MNRVKPYATYLYLCASIAVALLSLLSHIVGVISAVVVIVIFFKLKHSIVIAVLFLLFQYYDMHSAYVLDIEYRGKSPTIVTTKGWLKQSDTFNVDGSFHVGDLIWCDFKREISYSRVLPYAKYQPAGEIKTYQVPVITSFLKLRQAQSSMMVTLSGGKIHTTPAHIFAVRDHIPLRLNDQYVITGLAHLLSMSGFHVVILTGGIFLLLSFLPRKIRIFPALLLLPVLILLSGFTVTVQRSVIFAMAYMVAWLFGLKVNSVRFLAFLAASLILISPFNFYSISFLLSFTAILGIITVFKQQYGFAKEIIVMGLASTVFTLPLQLYFFGTANLLSVITTVLFTPILWAQMALGLLSLALPGIAIVPLANIEQFSEWFMNIISDVSWHFMMVAKPPLWLLVASGVVALVLVCTKYRLASMAIFILPLLPIYPDNILYFPQLPPSPKGYILKADGITEIFYQGMHSSFVYDMVPMAAELGIKTFDYGSVRVFDGDNLYLKIRNQRLSGKVCVNEVNDTCRYAYFTKSNTIKPPLNENIELYVIYNNKFKDDKIYIQKEKGELLLKLSK